MLKIHRTLMLGGTAWPLIASILSMPPKMAVRPKPEEPVASGEAINYAVPT